VIADISKSSNQKHSQTGNLKQEKKSLIRKIVRWFQKIICITIIVLGSIQYFKVNIEQKNSNLHE
jgi:hypothetical protein